MKFLKKIAYMLALSGMAFGLAACSNDNVEYEPAAPVEGAQVYFSTNNISSVNATVETTSFEVVVMRGGDTEEAVNVPIKAVVSVPEVEGEEAESTDPASLFTIPTVAKFAAGKDTVKLTIDIDRENLEDGQTYTIALTLNDLSVVTPYGNSTLTVSVVVPQPLKLLGTGYWVDDVVAPMWGVEIPTYPVEVYENLKNPGYIYLKDLYTYAYVDVLKEYWGAEDSDIESFMSVWPEESYIAIKVEDPDNVVIPGQNTYLSISTYGDIWFGSLSGAVGTLKDGIISFPTNGLVYQDNDGGYYANTSGMTKLYMPGTPMTDFSLELAYGGFRVAEDNETIYPIARAAYGEDVAEILYAFVAGDITKDAEALAAALAGIEDGSVVSNQVAVTSPGKDEETGEPILEMTLESVEGAEPGVFTVIAIPCDAEGEAQYGDLAFTSFYVQGVGAAETPEVDLELEWMPFSEAMPDYSADYPDYSTWCSLIYGSEIKSMKYFIQTTEAVDYYLSLGLTEQDMIDQAGSDFDPSKINENGVGIIYFEDMPADTSFTLVVWAENSYGKTVIKTVSGATAAEPSAKKGNAKLSWNCVNGKQIAFNPNEAMSISTIK